MDLAGGLDSEVRSLRPLTSRVEVQWVNAVGPGEVQGFDEGQRASADFELRDLRLRHPESSCSLDLGQAS
jgi:hypothetical protein